MNIAIGTSRLGLRVGAITGVGQRTTAVTSSGSSPAKAWTSAP